MALISRDRIDEMIQTIDIVDVISEYVSLQPSGKSMKGLCPFHNEKTPSFHVSKDKQIFNCFGCHKKGNVITFIQEYKHLDFIESVRYLADQYHIDLGEDDYQVERYNDGKLYDVNKIAKDFFNLNLLNLDAGKKALDYLENRGFTKQVLSQFDIGYAPANGNALLSNLKEKFQEFELVEAGLIGRSDSGNYYDLFRDRIMFPIHNEQGKVLGFSGRILKDDKNQAKYINTQSTKIFNKGNVLYNLHRALPFVNQRKRIVLMEGFFDVIQASMAGIEESVCSMGTELTLDQAKKIKKYTDSVVICYDGDQAGKQATYRALSILEKVNLNVQVALMPDGLDPDDYIKKTSKSHFRNQLNQHLIDKYDFVYEMIIQKGLSTSSQIETAKNALFKFLLSAASQTIKTIYLQKFAEAIELDYDVINQDFQRYTVNQRRFQTIEKSIQKVKLPPVSKARLIAEKKLINYYLQNDTYRDMIDDDFFQFKFLKGPRFEIFTAMREIYHGQREVALYNLKSDLSDERYQLMDDILLDEGYPYSELELKDLLDTLKLAQLEDEIFDLGEKIKADLKLNQKDNYPNYRDQLNDKKKTYNKIKNKRKNKSSNQT
jgi:DNA primase